MNRSAMRGGFCVCAVVCGFLVLAACDDFNRSLEDDIDFYRSVTPVSSWAELKSAAEGTAGPGLIGLAGDIELDSAATTINITRPLTVTAFEGRRVIRRGAAFTAYPLFEVIAGGELTLGYSHPKGGTLVLDGGALWDDAHTMTTGGVTATAPLVNVAGGVLTLRDGAVLQNNNQSAGNGGGVYVNSGSFEMKGGTISDNTASRNSSSSDGGGGVYVNSGSFEMKGGTISGNAARNIGGGVFVYGSGSFTMTGGTISGNSSRGGGGGVYFRSSSGAFTMNGGTISGNSSSSSNSGGVYVYGSSFEMNGGTISDNIAGFLGGGVYVYGGSFEMNGGTISGNIARNNGGGVYVYGGSFEMNGGTISGNIARNNGGGVSVSDTGAFTMSGNAAVSGNSGGGVSVGLMGSFEMKGGTISGNIATTSGGGVYVSSSSVFTKSGGVIYGSGEGGNSNLVKDGSGNPVNGQGHAVYVNSGPKKRDSTVGPGVTLDSGASGGWDP